MMIAQSLNILKFIIVCIKQIHFVICNYFSINFKISIKDDKHKDPNRLFYTYIKTFLKSKLLYAE